MNISLAQLYNNRNYLTCLTLYTGYDIIPLVQFLGNSAQTEESFVKKIFGILSLMFGIIGYGYQITALIPSNGEGLSVTTFVLWSVLAWITFFSMWKQGANPAIPGIYGLGATLTAVILLTKGRLQFAGLDVVVAVMTVVCIGLWFTQGARWALIMSVLAAVVAATPFVYMTIKDPSASLIVPNSCFLAANSLSCLAAKRWSMEDRLYPGVNIIVCLLLVIPWVVEKLSH